MTLSLGQGSQQAHKIILAGILFLSTLGQVNACMISYFPQKELKSEAGIIVLARVISIKNTRTSFRSKIYQYSIRVETYEKGHNREKNLIVIYEDLMAHRRGVVKICPRKHGSGIEQGLKVNQFYRIFLRSSSNFEILLAESVKIESPEFK
ncbi:hypothetical protein MNBD_GAMMA12-3822 [hydrothermal vent metagenome]|uniref:Uncharacterized protein n=1 Tax=hydrothermal vent metagenome TaxID=652676 RepID=A0A3B0YBF1_9ZZZZ